MATDTHDHVGVYHPDCVFVLIRDRAKFDEIGADATDHGDQGDKGHVLSKEVYDGKVRVIFQYWVKDPAFPWERREREQITAPQGRPADREALHA